ncbi:roadblock/LC7 domain-containing protein [Actinomadura harenae]|uniref:Roadblock/LAMTOR2 domain-containing protein n=1 Tax=Actinomadura harenae TaxID=2483351 RepID=A0A3M2LY26_9ACTN|nr:roadblock/LC7 domain-containing protein [Actinomadura harenae]RMI42112.1 hypothetical protein EBO15_20910 [Actinomadura harenae]
MTFTHVTGPTPGVLDDADLAALLSNFLTPIPKVVSALLASGDGLRMAAMGYDEGSAAADQLAAIVSGMTSLSKGVCALFGAWATPPGQEGVMLLFPTLHQER